ncbi:thioredoxin domain-containing protein [Novosphingobium album (ex Liu et al. 2023)]|uniref:Thioredoxin domain-containing protein n=1 Tax=Novosphingobium album (ex Liu et al. 2023) TaxID=3031130 RepID=A0ABT5WJX9_9SPHN|nr:thioredoxin domain-containing protein [Novosphingobium album (ex Liu et al. 2023)]MDE8650357.1 thioredoxin domain-containing protein [Novosphingobium album (ex Liu et al. 2023)]
MTPSTIRRIALGLIAAPLALGLAACGDKTGQAPTSGEPIAKIAPPAGQNWADIIEKTPEGGYRMGNPDAPIKLIEFGALSCSHCAEFAKESFTPLRDNYVASGRVSYELRLFMLNALDIPAALLATCGAKEAVIPLSEQFWAWQPEMFAKLQTVGDAQLQAASALPPQQRFQALADAAGMTEFFASRGIARDQAAACLADTAKATAFANETQEASAKYKVEGTPTFYINGSSAGTASWDVLEPKLQQAGAR